MKERAILFSVFAGAVVAPLLWWIGVTSGSADSFNMLMQANGVCIGLMIVASSFVALKRLGNSKENIVIIGAFTLLVWFWLAVVNTSSAVPSFDYRCIQNGTLNLLQGKSPYGIETGYVLYPPLYAQTMATTYSTILFVARQFHWHPQPEQVFHIIFYLFQNLQTVAFVSLVALSYKFALLTGRLSRVQATLLTFAVMALNYPLSGTILWNQVNLYIGCLVIFALIASERVNAWRGLALAVGIHLKAYPALLLPALILSRQWRPVAWTALWTVILGCLTSMGGWQIWTTYFHFASDFIADITAKPPIYMIDGSNLYSLVYATSKLFHPHSPVEPAAVNLIATFLKACLALWFGWRILKRQRGTAVSPSPRPTDLLYDNACDLLSFGLLAGPTTLNHHYVLAIPIIIWTAIKAGLKRPFAVLWGTALILGFQSHILSLMPLTPVGLIFLALARRDGGVNDPSATAEQTQVELEGKQLVSTLHQ